jgi:hypothetical protein
MLGTTLGLLIATTCPVGPNGGAAPYTHVHRDVRFEVEDGTARVIMVDELAAPADQHGHSAYVLELPMEDVAIVDAKIRSSAGELQSVQLSKGDEGEFADYLQALEQGSDPDDKARPWEHTPAPALRVTSDHSDFTVEVAGPCSVRSVTVEVEMIIGSDWHEGRLWFPVPFAPEEGTSRITVDAPGARASIANTPRGKLPVDEGLLEVTLDEPRLAGRWFETELMASELTEHERVRWGEKAAEYEETWLRARAEVDIPSPMSEVARPLSIAFVVDRSVSAGQAQLDAAAAQAQAVLDNAPPGSRYTVVAFARRPRVVGSAFMPTGHRAALRGLPARGLANGSDMAAAVAKARSILADTADGYEPRLIVLTDDLLLEPRDWSTSLEDAALTHAVVLSDWSDGWARIFAHEDRRARGVERTGGIRVRLGPEAQADLGLHLIRPTRIDRPQLFVRSAVVDVSADHTKVIVDDDEELGEYLLEGQGVRAILARRSAALGPETGSRLLGWVWASPLDLPLESSDRFDDAGTALATQDELANELPESFTLTLAESSGAVTRYTPREAVPDWRQPPPPPGFGFGMSGHGCCCGCGGFGTAGFGTSCRCGGIGRQLPDAGALLAAWLAEQGGCGAAVGESLSVTVWDLEVVAVEGEDTCRSEIVWSKLRLDREKLGGDDHDALFKPQRTWVVKLP